MTNQSHSFKLGNDWFINETNIFGAIVTSVLRDESEHSDNDSYTDIYIDDILTQRQRNGRDNSESFDNISSNLNYTHIFNPNKGKEIRVNADYGHYSLTDDEFLENKFETIESMILLPDPITFRANSTQRINMISARADYQQSFWKTGLLELGGKWGMTQTDNNSIREDFLGDSWQQNTGLSNAFKYEEQVAALYVSVAKMFNPKWTAKIGVRGEYTSSAGSWISAGKESNKSYLDLFPTAYVGYSPSPNWRFSFSYARRIDRPIFNQLNPIRRYNDANNSMEGNPNINPQFTDQLTLNFGYKSFLNVTALYFYTKDLIMQNPILNNLTGETLLLWSNLGSQNMLGGNISISELPIFRWMILNASLFGA